jgi:hypothetical protein
MHLTWKFLNKTFIWIFFQSKLTNLCTEENKQRSQFETYRKQICQKLASVQGQILQRTENRGKPVGDLKGQREPDLAPKPEQLSPELVRKFCFY